MSIRVGFVSTATICDKVLPAIQESKKTECVAVGSRSEEKAKTWAEKRGVPTGTTYDELIKDKSIDALYIPLPSGLRNDWIRKAAMAGKHVYAEKPFAGTAKEIQDLITLCEEKKVQFMDGTMWLHSNRTKEITRRIEGREIGEVRRVTASFTFKAPDDEWLNGGNGRTDKSREPMGCFGDQGWYPIGAILWAYGFELPTKVQMTYTSLNKVNTIVGCGGVMWFKGNKMATFDAGAEMAHRSQVEIVGTDGVIKIDDLVGGQGRSGNFEAYEKPFVGSGKFIQGDVMGKDQVVEVEECDHVLALVDDFAECCINKQDNIWPKRTLATHTVMCALFESSQKGGIAIDL